MPLKEYVDSRFSTPEEILRFKSVQWVIGYVLGMAGEVGSAVGTLVTLFVFGDRESQSRTRKKEEGCAKWGTHVFSRSLVRLGPIPLRDAGGPHRTH